MAEHTPGPWFEEEGSIFSENSGTVSTGNPIAHVDFEPDRECLGGEADALTEIWAEQHANARLISAAPELLEALEQIEQETAATWIADIARAAIAKAKGEDK